MATARVTPPPENGDYKAVFLRSDLSAPVWSNGYVSCESEACEKDAQDARAGVSMSKTAIRKLQTRDFLGSAFGFGLVLTTLVVMDPRVSHKFSRAFYPSPSEKLLSWGDRLVELLSATVMAARDQSIDNLPMLVLTVVSILLVGFMVRT
jgi:hypothetical protein